MTASSSSRWVGATRQRGSPRNLVAAIDVARERGSTIVGIVGRDGGDTARHATACVVIPPLHPDHVTPHTEGLCAVVWHLLVTHPALKTTATKWESMAGGSR